MKKIFTTLLMMGVALTSWGFLPADDPTVGDDPYFDSATGVLTVRYNQYMNKGKSAENIVDSEWRGNVKKLVLIGEYTNEDCNAIDGMIRLGVGGDGSSKTLYLDLEGCTGFFCKVQPAGDDWTSSEYEYYYTDAMTTQNVVKVSKLIENGQIFTGDQNALISDGEGGYYYYAWTEDGAPYTGDTSTLTQDDENENLFHYTTQESEDGTPKHEPIFYDEAEGKYYFDDWYDGRGPKHYLVDVTHNVTRSINTVTEQSVWVLENNQNTLVDEDAHEITLIDETRGTIPVHAYGTKFFETFNSKKFLNGITFPCGSNFTAIPEKFLRDADSNNSAENKIKTVSFGANSSLQWIGKEAFTNLPQLGRVTFPTSLIVIGGDAFKDCVAIDTVNLSNLSSLQKIDYMAFGMDDTKGSILSGLLLPAGNTLTFFGNYMTSGTQIRKLDMSQCTGITRFAYDDQDSRPTFWHSHELDSIALPPNLTYLMNGAFNSCEKLTKVVFTGSADYDMDTCVEGGTNTINNALIIGEAAFKDLHLLKDVKLSNNITEIRADAFHDTGLEKIVIPASVQLVGSQAFKGCGDLKVVVFDEIDPNCAPCQHAKTLVKGLPDGTGAFRECDHLTDVYVNTVVDLDCENKAFDYATTFGHTNTSAPLATLHFPEGHEENYVNLQHYLTNEIAADPGLFQDWLQEHFNLASDPEATAHNMRPSGWYEFVNSGPSKIDPDDPEPTYNTGIVLRTFSDPNYARLVPDGLRAYVVNNLQFNDSIEGYYEVILQRIQVIPAQTGVILYGQPNSKDVNGNPVLSLTPTVFKEGHGQPLRRDYWDKLTPADQHLKNYLMPLIDSCMIRTVVGETEKLTKTNLLTVNPYEPYVKGATVEWRNFALNRAEATEHLKTKVENFNATNDNFVGFFRILPDTYNGGLAYLHLSAEEYLDPQGAEILVDPDEFYNQEYDVNGVLYDINGTNPETNQQYSNPNGWWTGDHYWTERTKSWGTRPNKFNLPHAFSYLGEFEDDADGIVKLVVPATTTSEGDIYNLQGVKVTNPTKGVYVRNGKKVIIK